MDLQPFCALPGRLGRGARNLRQETAIKTQCVFNQVRGRFSDHDLHGRLFRFSMVGNHYGIRRYRFTVPLLVSEIVTLRLDLMNAARVTSGVSITVMFPKTRVFSAHDGLAVGDMVLLPPC